MAEPLKGTARHLTKKWFWTSAAAKPDDQIEKFDLLGRKSATGSTAIFYTVIH